MKIKSWYYGGLWVVTVEDENGKREYASRKSLQQALDLMGKVEVCTI